MKFSIITDKLKQYPLAFVCSLLLIVLSVVIFFRGGVTSELSLKESELNSRIRTIDENIKNSKNLERDTEDLEAIVEKMDTSLFNRYERAMNVSFFYEFEDKADVIISSISQLSEPDPIYSDRGARELDLHSTLVFDISLRGSFSSILSFLYEVDRAESLIRVGDLQVSRSGGATAANSVDARVRLIVMAEKD